MIRGPLAVHLFTEPGSKQSVIELWKMGYRLPLYRSAPNQPAPAAYMAKALADFLDVPLFDDAAPPGTPYHPSSEVIGAAMMNKMGVPP